MTNRYRALRTIGMVYKVLGVIAAALSALAILGVCATSLLGGAVGGGFARDFGGFAGSLFSGILGGLLISLGVLLYGGVIAVTLYAFGEAIDLFISLEDNTRRTAELLQQRPS